MGVLDERSRLLSAVRVDNVVMGNDLIARGERGGGVATST